MTDQNVTTEGAVPPLDNDEVLNAEAVADDPSQDAGAASSDSGVESAPHDSDAAEADATEPAETVGDDTEVSDDEDDVNDAVADSGDSDDAANEGDADWDSDDSTASAPPTKSGASRAKQLEREGEVAADFLETLLDIADLDGDIDVDIDGDRAALAIVDSEDGRVPRRLVGTDGKVLDALQELTRLAVQSATGERSRLMLDIAGFRAGRRAALVEVARAAITSVKESGTEQRLEPMTAFERKVVHDEVLAAGLHSESDGSEPNRYVVIQPA